MLIAAAGQCRAEISSAVSRRRPLFPGADPNVIADDTKAAVASYRREGIPVSRLIINKNPAAGGAGAGLSTGGSPRLGTSWTPNRASMPR